jgi:hypothetical protein
VQDAAVAELRDEFFEGIVELEAAFFVEQQRRT